jgi:hypothetical protein
MDLFFNKVYTFPYISNEDNEVLLWNEVYTGSYKLRTYEARIEILENQLIESINNYTKLQTRLHGIETELKCIPGGEEYLLEEKEHEARIGVLDKQLFESTAKHNTQLAEFMSGPPLVREGYLVQTLEEHLGMLQQKNYEERIDILEKLLFEKSNNCTKLETRLENAETELKYRPGGEGYLQAKEQFENLQEKDTSRL